MCLPHQRHFSFFLRESRKLSYRLSVGMGSDKLARDCSSTCHEVSAVHTLYLYHLTLLARYLVPFCWPAGQRTAKYSTECEVVRKAQSPN